MLLVVNITATNKSSDFLYRQPPLYKGIIFLKKYLQYKVVKTHFDLLIA